MLCVKNITSQVFFLSINEAYLLHLRFPVMFSDLTISLFLGDSISKLKKFFFF